MACTSPRTAQLLHQIGDLKHLLDVDVVRHQSPRFGGKPTAAALAFGGLSDGLTGRFGAGDASAPGDLVKRAQTVGPET